MKSTHYEAPLMQFSTAFCYFFFLYIQALILAAYSQNILILRSSSRVTEQVSHKYEAMPSIIILIILSFEVEKSTK